MNYVTGNAVVGLPALIGVVLGLRLYVEGLGLFLGVVIGLIILAALALWIGRAIMRRQPRVGTLFIELWILAAIGVTALATAFITWVGLDGPFTWILGISDLKSGGEKISAAFLAAVSTYVALVWTKDIGDAKGFFWPSTQFKSAIAAAFKQLKPQPSGKSLVFQATFDDYVEGQKAGGLGWTFCARQKRAAIFQRHLQAQSTIPKPAP